MVKFLFMSLFWVYLCLYLNQLVFSWHHLVLIFFELRYFSFLKLLLFSFQSNFWADAINQQSFYQGWPSFLEWFHWWRQPTLDVLATFLLCFPPTLGRQHLWQFFESKDKTKRRIFCNHLRWISWLTPHLLEFSLRCT